MKIIQSYAQFEKGSPRVFGDKEKNLLSFYSFLLSYLTLNKYYGKIRMYCNEAAQNSLIKYIPYDEVKIMENKNSELFWSYYKVDVMKSMRTDFIHVDSDVFIFDDLFSNFINDKTFDVIIQNQIYEDHYVRDYVDKFKSFIIENDLIDPNIYDGGCASCGTVGMRIGRKKQYIDVCETIKKGFIKAKTENAWYIGMASEELAMYIAMLKYKYKSYEILPYDDVIKYGEKIAANYHKYTHMYIDSKFQPKYVKAIRMKTLYEFPEAINLIKKYETEKMMDTKILGEIL
jgi:hypothetical protein